MKQLLTLIVAFASLVFVPTAFAQTATPSPTPEPTKAPQAPAATTQTVAVQSSMWGTDLRHAYTPSLVNNNQWVRARINNMSGVSQHNPVCVEAFQGATKTHLGCLTVPWQEANWTQEFDAPLTMLGSGTYSIHYTYKKQDGSWVGIKTHDDMMTWPSVTK